MTHIVVCEYARLTTERQNSSKNTLDWAYISQSAFDYLCNSPIRNLDDEDKTYPYQLENRNTLRLNNYVGFIQTPCGTQIEILPKIAGKEAKKEEEDRLRKILQKILITVLQVPSRYAGSADIELHTSLLEWIIRLFLKHLDTLFKRGIRFDYQEVQEEQKYLKGRLNIIEQLRQPPGKDHIFQIRHAVFLPDRAENRLLKNAIEKICRQTQDPENWRLAHIFSGMMAEVPESVNEKEDFQLWQTDRLMAHYQDIKPWCELILGESIPLAIKGDKRHISLLFPMESLFEEYIHIKLNEQVKKGILRKKASKHLCSYQNENIFNLQPDLVHVVKDKDAWIMDAKWKLLDQSTEVQAQNYGILQSDLYQLFAYGHKYLEREGGMFLIYPKTSQFDKPIGPYKFKGTEDKGTEEKLNLWAVPFDLEKDELIFDYQENQPVLTKQLSKYFSEFWKNG